MLPAVHPPSDRASSQGPLDPLPAGGACELVLAPGGPLSAPRFLLCHLFPQGCGGAGPMLAGRIWIWGTPYGV